MNIYEMHKLSQEFLTEIQEELRKTAFTAKLAVEDIDEEGTGVDPNRLAGQLELGFDPKIVVSPALEGLDVMIRFVTGPKHFAVKERNFLQFHLSISYVIIDVSNLDIIGFKFGSSYSHAIATAAASMSRKASYVSRNVLYIKDLDILDEYKK